MFSNLLALLSAYLFTFAAAASAASASKRHVGHHSSSVSSSVSASTILSEVEAVTSEFNTLNKLVTQYKAAGYGPSANFTSTLGSTLTSVEKLASDLSDFDIFEAPSSELVSAFSELISASFDFAVNFALWVLVVGKSKFTQSLSLTVSSLKTTVSSLSIVCNGHSSYSPLADPLGQSNIFGHGLGSLWGFNF